MTEPLPDLVTRLKGDVSDLLRAISEARAAEKAYTDEQVKNRETIKKSNDSAGQSDKDYTRLVTYNVKSQVTALSDLEKAYASLKARRDELQRGLAVSGDKNIFGDLKTAESDMSKLSGYIKDMGGNTDVISQGFAEAEASATDMLPVVASIAAFLAPLLGGAAAGGVLALLGGGGLAAGVAGQLHSPAVQSALGDFKAEVGAAFHSATAQFAPDTAKALETAGAGTGHFLDALQPAFERLAPYIDKLAQGLDDAETNLLPGLEKGLDAAGPVIGAIADDLPMLATAIGSFFEQLAKGGQGAGEALTVVLDLLGTIIVATGYTLSALSQGFDHLARGVRDVTAAIVETESILHIADPVLGGLYGQLAKLTGETSHLSEANSAVSDSSRESAGAVDQLTYSYEQLNNQFLAYENEAQRVDDANLTMHQDLLNFHTELKKGAQYWDLNTKAGLKNVGLLDQVNKGITDYYDSLRVNGNLTTDQTKAELAELIAQRDLAKAYGATGDELSTLNGEINNLQKQLAGLPPSKTVNIKVNVSTSQLNKVNNTLQRLGAGANSGVWDGNGMVPHFADSGVFQGGPQPLYRFAEQSVGEEALIAKNGDKNRALASLGEAASWFADDISRTVNYNSSSVNNYGGGGGGTIVVPLILDGNVIARAIIPAANRMNGRSSTSIYGGR